MEQDEKFFELFKQELKEGIEKLKEEGVKVEEKSTDALLKIIREFYCRGYFQGRVSGIDEMNGEMKRIFEKANGTFGGF